MNQVSEIGIGSVRRVRSLASEFKEFAFKGNLIDMATAVIIGAAFAKLLDSFVKNIIMPLISLAIPGQQAYLEWQFTVNGKVVPYGLFIGDIVSFLLIALTLFVFLVKVVGWLMRAKKQEEVAPQALTKDQQLLTEIRDLLLARSPVEK